MLGRLDDGPFLRALCRTLSTDNTSWKVHELSTAVHTLAMLGKHPGAPALDKAIARVDDVDASMQHSVSLLFGAATLNHMPAPGVLAALEARLVANLDAVRSCVCWCLVFLSFLLEHPDAVHCHRKTCGSSPTSTPCAPACAVALCSCPFCWNTRTPSIVIARRAARRQPRRRALLRVLVLCVLVFFCSSPTRTNVFVFLLVANLDAVHSCVLPLSVQCVRLVANLDTVRVLLRLLGSLATNGFDQKHNTVGP